MADAKSLKDLMRIRAFPENRQYLDSINGSLGTALGFKRRTGESVSEAPAIIVFVPEKIHRKWLPATQLIKSELKGPGNLRCPLDVVAGSKAVFEQPVPESGTALAQRLRGWDEKIWCGSQISTAIGNQVTFGSLGAFVRRNSDDLRGFITNHHVVSNQTVWHPWAPGSPGFPAGTRLIGRRQKSLIESPVEEWYGPFAAERGNPHAAVRVDCSLCSLEASQLQVGDVQPEPLVEPPLLPGPFGPVFEIDLTADMRNPRTRIVGRDVYRAGRTTGVRKGQIAAFAYEWQDQPANTRYADLLIRGESLPVATGVEMTVPFSYKGDSGSVVFLQLDGDRRPVALLWGGFQEQLRGGSSQENWSYATRLDRILDTMDLALVGQADELFSG